MLHILYRIAPLGIALSALIIVTLSLVLPTKTVVVYVDSNTNTDAGQRAFRSVPSGDNLMEIGGAAAGIEQCDTVESAAPGASWI